MSVTLPEQWRRVRLGDICKINPRARLALGPTTPVSFVPMAAVDERSGSITDAQEKPLAEVSRGYTAFAENDVLFAKITPCMENGKAAIARDLSNGVGFGSTEFHVLRPNSYVLPELMFQFVRQQWFRDAAAASFTGSGGQRRVPVSFLEQTLFPIPPLSEQQRIIEVLNEVESVRRLRAEAELKTAELIPALFHEMFGEPAHNAKGWRTDLLGNCGELGRVHS